MGALRDAASEKRMPKRETEEVMLRAWLACQYKPKDVSSLMDGTTLQQQPATDEQKAVLDVQGMQSLANLDARRPLLVTAVSLDRCGSNTPTPFIPYTRGGERNSRTFT